MSRLRSVLDPHQEACACEQSANHVLDVFTSLCTFTDAHAFPYAELITGVIGSRGNVGVGATCWDKQTGPSVLVCTLPLRLYILFEFPGSVEKKTTDVLARSLHPRSRSRFCSGHDGGRGVPSTAGPDGSNDQRRRGGRRGGREGHGRGGGKARGCSGTDRDGWEKAQQASFAGGIFHSAPPHCRYGSCQRHD